MEPSSLFGKPMAGLAARCLGEDAAACASFRRNLLRAAAADSFHLDWQRWFASGRDDHYNATLTGNNFMVQVATAYAVLRDRLDLAPGERDQIEGWLGRRAEEYFNRWPFDGTTREGSNHYAASASLQMAVGVIRGDATRYQRGIEQFHRTMGTLRADGSLPNETRRTQHALMYTSKTLSHLVYLAEVAAHRGSDLYAEGAPRTLHAAVTFFLDAMNDHRLIEPYAWAQDQPAGGAAPMPQDLTFIARFRLVAWFEPYLARFPDHPNAPRLRALARHYGITKPLGVEDWFGGQTSCYFARTLDW
ncbi:MAG: hypothetical protein EXQ96_01440 [Alphaproteobacteria bacterium]|nr:hypothetical protein [Alphaproteobacteria bacterium]